MLLSTNVLSDVPNDSISVSTAVLLLSPMNSSMPSPPLTRLLPLPISITSLNLLPTIRSSPPPPRRLRAFTARPRITSLAGIMSGRLGTTPAKMVSSPSPASMISVSFTIPPSVEWSSVRLRRVITTLSLEVRANVLLCLTCRTL